MVFTCGSCNTRSVKAFSRNSYEKGIVIVRCPGCNKQHLIADNLGWFGDNFRVADLANEKGERVMHVSLDQATSDPQLLTREALLGWSRAEQVMAAVTGAPPSTSHNGDAKGTGEVPDDVHDDVLEMQSEDLDSWAKVTSQKSEGNGPEGQS